MNKDVIQSKKHLGQITRGKTTVNRLRRVDQFVLQFDPMLIRRNSPSFKDAIYVDHGFGWSPVTTLESARQFHAVNPRLKVVGVEISPERVDTGMPFVNEFIDFRIGGFDIPYAVGEQARLIRSFNVLRQYEESEFEDSIRQLAEGLIDGGLLIEGTSNPSGRIWCANLIRKLDEEIHYEGLVFSTNFRDGFSPQDFQPFLPKNFIHHMQDRHPIYEFIQAWHKASQTTMYKKDRSIQQWYASCIEEVSALGFNVETRRQFTRRGFCILKWKNQDFEARLNQ